MSMKRLTSLLTSPLTSPLAATLAASLISGLAFAAPALAGTEVGVSVQISQPGVYGRIDIGRFPQPVLVVQQPVWVARPVQVVEPVQPVYMWVPPGHQKHWSKHCARYGACGTPVYFVQDRWYQQQVMPHEHEHDGRVGHERDRARDEWRGKGHDKDHDKGRGRDHHD